MNPVLLNLHELGPTPVYNIFTNNLCSEIFLYGEWKELSFCVNAHNKMGDVNIGREDVTKNAETAGQERTPSAPRGGVHAKACFYVAFLRLRRTISRVTHLLLWLI